MSNISYRKAFAAEVGIISGLADRIWKKHYITIITMEQIEYMLKRMYSDQALTKQMEEGHDFTIVSVNGKDVGYISLSKNEKNEYFLHKFYVEVDEQGKGIGTKLFEYILTQLVDARSIKLTVNRKNYKAINFYFKNGFIIDEVADFDIGDGYFMNDFVMLKKLP